MLNRLFDSPAQLLILVLIIVLLFGATRLPNVARQLGRSMRIFKSEMKEMKQDGRTEQGEEKAGDADAESTDPAPLEGTVVEDKRSQRSASAREGTARDA